MIPAEVQAIFFDAVGTLLFPEPSAAAIYAEVGRRHGSRLTVNEIRLRFAAAFAREEAADLAGGLRTSEERERQRWQNIVAAVLDDAADPDACFRDLYEHFARPAAWRVDPSAGHVLRQLQDRGYRLGMASNFDRRLREVVAGLPELEPLTWLVISSEIGWRKPSPEFFAAVCRTADALPQRILLVGDDPVNDVQGALAASMHALMIAGRLSELT
ncbi:MAG: HAD-IA family hydrolase [Planctomycetes bacterium]|nr:HAD-IA family hydrolase [Planctomycetota bacterium]